MADMKDLVREARERLGMNQEEFAHAVGVSTSSITRLERGLAPDDGPAARLVLQYLSQHTGGPSLSSGKPGASTPGAIGPTLPSTMAQMVGRLQVPAGSEDYYMEMMQVAERMGASAEVFRDLWKARSEAPADARSGWWTERLMTAMKQSSR